MVEFALSLPLLLTVLVATIVFGVAFNNQQALTAATTAGAQQLSISRGQTSDPCATTSATVQAAVGPSITQGSLGFSVAFGSGNPVTYGSPFTGTSCTGAANDMVSGNTAKVTVTYPCNLEVYGFNIVPGCTLTAQTAELIQ
jgi:Flp pilus assembly protein TadG